MKREKSIKYKQENKNDSNYKKAFNMFYKNKEGLHEKQETKEMKTTKRRSDKHKLQRAKTTKKSFSSFKKVMVSIGIVFVLALIAYTTILYGGKLLVNEEQLTITSPTTDRKSVV